MSTETRQWMRTCTVLVGKNLQNGIAAGIKITANRVKFTVEKNLRGPPNTANIQIYNLAPANEGKIRQEFDDVLLDCGYVGNPRIIFHGNIRFATRYREENDWVTELQAADGDRDYLKSRVDITLAPGSTPTDAVLKLLDAMPNTRRGSIQLGTRAYLRHKVLSGSARHVLEQLARDSGANWSIQNGYLDIVPADAVLPNHEVVVNSRTGMLGTPEISAKGIRVRMALNPLVKPNGVLLLDNNDIKIQALQQFTNGPKTKAKKIAHLDPDGRYKVYKLRSEGDTRGKAWYTECDCVGIGRPIPSSKVAA